MEIKEFQNKNINSYFSYLIKNKIKLNVAKTIDHTLLKANCNLDEIKKLCIEADKYKFCSVCVNPCFVKYAKTILKSSEVKICTVIGFPLGANTTFTKVNEAIDAVLNGADEIDMVINVSSLKSNDLETLEYDINQVVKAVPSNIVVKVILETCYLTDKEIELACLSAIKAKANFVKTSTGFGNRGASVNDILIMKSQVKDKLKIKASGGIREWHTLKEMINAGADRIGTSSGVKIMEEINNMKI